MKRFLSLLMTAIIILSLAGCGAYNGNIGTGSSKPPSSPSPSIAAESPDPTIDPTDSNDITVTTPIDEPLTKQIEGDYEFTIHIDKTVEITKYNGVDVDVDIPAKLGGYNVTVIGANSFAKNNSPRGITIPEGVKTIGRGAFSTCANLKSINFPKSIESIETYYVNNNNTKIFYTPFYQTPYENDNTDEFFIINNILLRYNGEHKEELIVPDGVVSIGSFAFPLHGGKDIVLPKSIITICESAFQYTGEWKLNNISLPNGLISIGASAFAEQILLHDLTIPDSVTYIGEYAFYNNTSLNEVVIPKNVSYIGDYAFACEGIGYAKGGVVSITFNNEVAFLGKGIFTGNSNLANVSLPDGFISIGDEMFSGCFNLASIALPDSITNIGEGAFRGCQAFTDITLPSKLQSISASLFEDCYNLSELTIPDSITSIGDKAFSNCNSITSIAIPNNVGVIGREAFAMCSKLESLVIPDSVTSIGDRLVYSSSNAVVYCSKDSYTYKYCQENKVPASTK